MNVYDKAQLVALFRERAIRFGDFTLASGQKSSYYVDKMQITLHAAGLRQASLGLLELIADVEYDALGGMTLGADPIIGSMLTLAADQGRDDLVGAIVRKEAKGHGTGNFIEGPVAAGQRVVVIEDVVTTGGSAIQAVDRLLAAGCTVPLVVGIVDRLQGGAAAFAERNLAYRSLLTIEDLGVTPPDDA